jgi:hypothetical protein
MERDPSEVDLRETEESTGDRKETLFDDLGSCLREYARQHPVGVALACIGIGVYLGWRLKR